MDYQTVEDPALLVARQASDDDIAAIRAISNLICQGTDLTAEQGATQLNCYYLGGQTLVVPINGPASLTPWIFDGDISTADCIAWYKASIGITATEETA